MNANEFEKTSDKMFWGVWNNQKSYLDNIRNIDDTTLVKQALPALAREIWHIAFRMGARFDQRTCANLSPHLAQFMEYVSWIQLLDSDDIVPTGEEPYQKQHPDVPHSASIPENNKALAIDRLGVEHKPNHDCPRFGCTILPPLAY